MADGALLLNRFCGVKIFRLIVKGKLVMRVMALEAIFDIFEALDLDSPMDAAFDHYLGIVVTDEAHVSSDNIFQFLAYIEGIGVEGLIDPLLVAVETFCQTVY